MPSGGNTPLNDQDWNFISNDFKAASEHGLQYEWLRWFVGGLVEDKLSVCEASTNACIEWDF